MSETRHISETQASFLLAGVVFAGLVGVCFALAGTRFNLPLAHLAGAAHELVAWAAGLSILIAGGATIFIGGLQRHHVSALLAGVVVILIGLPLVGVTVGVPAVLAPFLDLLNLLIRLLNGLLDFLAFLGRLLGA